jgi:hypothetical protein
MTKTPDSVMLTPEGHLPTGYWPRSALVEYAPKAPLMARIAEVEAANRGLVRLNEVTEKRYQERADAVLYLQALLDDCAEYLKDGETPRQRMDRDHHDVLSLMEMLAKDRAERDAGRARIAELEAALSDIAAQKTVAENGNEMGDVEYGYDACITVARRALAKAPTP